MRAVVVVRSVFMLVGVAMLAGAAYLAADTSRFLHAAVRAEGEVVDLERVRSDNSTTWRPVVRFTAGGGRPVEFASAVSSNPPAYARGERVQVLYLPHLPEYARLDGFFSLWGAATVVGLLGTVFLGSGLGITAAGWLKARRIQALQAHGTPVQAQLLGVDVNRSLTVNGRHPWRISAQWQNPATSMMHVFVSDNLWYDPTAHVKGPTLRVLIDPADPRRYHVDLSFLPVLAA